GRVMTEVTPQGQVQVEAGNKMLTVAAADLERTAGRHAETAPAASKRSRQSRRRDAATESVAPELRLLGSTVDDALPAVEQYLDRATVQGIPRVRIIHGIGSGRLRDAIADFLQHHPLVHRFYSGDTGGGTTIVELEG
ncbi:MAG: Smr/MutS family protein, partial [Candidatus Tectomicrobia bacterium]|nr:Smr/MutS family protein [Candidatus Tectomicrobia bacterium]